MTHLERSAHRPKMLASLVNHVIGVLDHPDQVEQWLKDLQVEQQLDPDRVEVLSGQAGEDRMDADGSRHGLLARWRRSVQRLTDEYADALRYQTELEAGHFVVLVGVHDSERAHQVCHLLRVHGGHFVRFFGSLVVQQFCPDSDTYDSF